MMRVTTLYARSARATAEYYTKYLTKADGELPGRWTGQQAPGLGLTGEVTTEALEALLSGTHPTTHNTLGRPFADRTTKTGATIPAVAGFDATLSAPKSLSVWWALTGDDGLAVCHDIAVKAVIDTIEKYGATTRVRSNGRRMHLDTNGLTVAVFRQSTSRADDPNLHTHVVISSKVQTADGRWLALDARMLKKHQRTLGGLYQSVLRAELTHRYGVAFNEIVSGQAEIAGISPDVLNAFSKRTEVIDAEMTNRLAEFVDRNGRDPSIRERAAIERATAADTRDKKTDATLPDLKQRWEHEAAHYMVNGAILTRDIADAARRQPAPPTTMSIETVVEQLSEKMSTWHRMDVLRALCDTAPQQPNIDGKTWIKVLDRSVDAVLDTCIDLDPTSETTPRRTSDGRSVWIEPIASHSTSSHVLAQEEHILTFATTAQLDPPTHSSTIDGPGLDGGQHEAAAAIAGNDRLVLVVGPAGAGKTTMLRSAVTDLHANRRAVIGLAPTAKAAHVLETETGMLADTVAKLLYDLDHPENSNAMGDPGPGTTVIIDEAGMLNTADLHQIVVHAEQREWRVALVGDPYQLQAVGRGGMFKELCDTGRIVELEHLHRFTNRWEAQASLQLREGSPAVLYTYEAHDRIKPGTLDEHFDTITNAWAASRNSRETISITTTRNEDVESINNHIQRCRITSGELDTDTLVELADDDWAMIGDIVATRRNDRRLRTSTGEAVRNRERWSVVDTNRDGEITVTRLGGHGTVTLPADYVRQHVRLAYATTEHGAQGETADRSITLATNATTGRGLYVGMTRGRDENVALVVTETHDIAEARDILETALAIDRADVPATRHRRDLHATVPQAPALRPRCIIPDWFDEYRASVGHQLESARAELADSRAESNERWASVKGLEDRYGELEKLCAPIDQEVRNLGQAVEEVERLRRSASRAANNAGPFGRRRARIELNDVTDALNGARHDLDEYRSEHAQLLDERANAAAAIRFQRNEADTSDTLAEWDGLPKQFEQLDGLAQALDTWRSWANGRSVAETDLSDAVDTLQRIKDDQPRSLVQSLGRDEHTAIERDRIADIDGPGLEIDF